MARDRVLFLDGVRGVALILMVLNHTGRDWLDRAMGWPVYYFVYGTLLLPAPIFLFLVGFCLPLAHRPGAAAISRVVPSLRRGLMIVGAGLLLNAVVLRDIPILSGGVLQTIGLGIMLLGPAVPLLEGRRWARGAALGLAAAVYLSFVWAFPALTRWSAAHPVLARTVFNDFPPWPWLAAALAGLALGWEWLDARSAAAAEARYFRWTAAFGAGCLVAYVAWEWWIPTAPRFGFPRDFLLNRHWTPRGATLLLVAAGVAILLAALWWLMQVRGWPLPWLVTLGQNALVLYFVHQLIELTLVRQTLGLRITSWWLYAAATLALIALLVPLGRAGQALQRRLPSRRVTLETP